MVDPGGDVTANYLQVMRERGWSFDDLADDLDRQAAQPALDGGAATRNLARWAREQAAAERRRAAADTLSVRDLRPDEATPDPPRRTTHTPGRPRRG